IDLGAVVCIVLTIAWLGVQVKTYRDYFCPDLCNRRTLWISPVIRPKILSTDYADYIDYAERRQTKIQKPETLNSETHSLATAIASISTRYSSRTSCFTTTSVLAG